MYFSPVFKHYFIMKSQCETIQCIELLKLNTQYTPPTCLFLSFVCHQSVKKDTGLSVALLTSTERMVLTKAIVSFTTP